MSVSCPKPFVLERNFPASGGDVGSRVCIPIPSLPGFPTCCLPCPLQNWVYPDSFTKLISASTYVNLAGVACAVFLLLSYAVLSVEYTHKHYLSVCLVIAILILQTSFVIPLGYAHPQKQCFDPITPHDMYSSVNCALSGSFLLGGGWCVAMWIFLRTLSLHLQICWQMIPGKRFFLAAQAIGWSVPVIFLAIALSITGVSFRFGDSCHINSKQSLRTFWGPILAVTTASIMLHTVTFFYCIKVYIKSLLDDKQETELSLPYANSFRTVTPVQAFRRIQHVIALQWRGIMVVIIIIVDVVFFATVFLKFDRMTDRTNFKNLIRATTWLSCMLKSDGEKGKCLHLASPMVIPEQTALAVIFLLSCNGIWALLLLGHWKLLVGWYRLFRDLVVKKPSDEFVSFNARKASEPDPSYEMLCGKQAEVKPPEPAAPPPSKLQYQPSFHSSILSSNPGSPESELARTPQFSNFSYKADIGEQDFLHALSPTPAHPHRTKL